MTQVATSDDVAFIDRVLESWAAWARDAGLPLCSQSSMRYSSGRVGHSHALPMSDDSFASVDRAVAKLQPQRRQVIFMHYARSDCESMSSKARMLGITIGCYGRLLRHAQLDVYENIATAVDAWRPA